MIAAWTIRAVAQLGTTPVVPPSSCSPHIACLIALKGPGKSNPLFSSPAASATPTKGLAYSEILDGSVKSPWAVWMTARTARTTIDPATAANTIT